MQSGDIETQFSGIFLYRLIKRKKIAEVTVIFTSLSIVITKLIPKYDTYLALKGITTGLLNIRLLYKIRRESRTGTLCFIQYFPKK